MGAAIVICYCFGFVCIFIGLLLKDKNKIIESIESEKVYKLDYLSDKITKQVEEADGAFENLNALSGDIFNELEDKYQELLFLYQLMDDKKKDLPAPKPQLTTEEKRAHVIRPMQNPPKQEQTPESEEVIAGHKERESLLMHLEPRYESIKNRRDNGESIAEIAKSLGVGQGEIQFILGLGNKR